MLESGRVNIDLSNEQMQEIPLNNLVVATYGLEKWSKEFSLMTAGYRDRLDPDDAGNPSVPFNLLTMGIMAEAKARVYARKLAPGAIAHVHIGGEVRPHTRDFIQVAARVYAANGFRVHLRQGVRTTPIWYSSFGIIYEGYQSGDNLTASHSAYYKGGWKPLDGEGKQLTDEEAEIIAEVQRIVASRSVIRLAPLNSDGSISYDFDVDAAYAAYQRAVLGENLFTSIERAGRRGLEGRRRFVCMACPLGGSMGATSRRLLTLLGISVGNEGCVRYFWDAEDFRFHRLGEIAGQNYGADPSKREIYRNIGAQQRLLDGDASIVFIWDPDGDRFNIVTSAPIIWSKRAVEVGLEVEEFPDRGKCIIYFTPNQIYFLLVDYRIALLKSQNLLRSYDWFVGASYPTSMAVEELCAQEGIPVVRVPVGFKNIGDLCRSLEQPGKGPKVVSTATGHTMTLGPNPRALILCEESGGACLGGADLLRSRDGSRTLLSLREKDGMQIALLTLALAGFLFESDVSFAQHYSELIVNRGIQLRYMDRQDVRLYDESLMGDELLKAKAEGFQRRDKVMQFFGGLVKNHADGRMSLAAIRKEILDRSSGASGDIPEFLGACWVEGDGPLFVLDGMRLLVRASGTDALLRYYVEGSEQALVQSVQNVLASLQL